MFLITDFLNKIERKRLEKRKKECDRLLNIVIKKYKVDDPLLYRVDVHNEIINLYIKCITTDPEYTKILN